MRLLADLHTHSVASGHAYSTIGELASAAAAKGLELIAVTDHGPSLPGAPHEWHFGNLKALPSVIGGVRVLKGIEANLVPDSGTGLDAADDDLAKLDFVAAGLHPNVGFDGAATGVLTDALVRVVANPLVDMITHPGNPWLAVDVERVVAACLEHGVIVEINNASYETSVSRSHDTAAELAFAREAARAGAFVAINSDAHYHAHVGRFERALEVAEMLGIDEGRIVNRDAASVLEFLLGRRERPRLDLGGEVD